MARFGRVLTAMITPFDHDGALDLDGAAKLASWLVEQGNEGLVIAGTTGESPTLTHEEQIELVRTVCQAVSVPVIAGAGSNDTRAAIELTEQATAAGASAILSVTPYYNRPSQAGLFGALPRDRRVDRLADHALRHPGAYRPQSRHGDGARARARCAQHRCVERCRRQPRRDRAGDRAAPPRASRCTAATTRSTCRCCPSARSAW